MARTMDKHDSHAERAEDGDIEQDVGKIFGGRDNAIDGDHKDTLTKAGDILQDFSQVGNIHGMADGVTGTPRSAIQKT
jgi:hypothetical protein